MQKISVTLIVTLVCLYTTTAQNCEKGPSPCVDQVTGESTMACTFQYAPVCGCDCKTYGNDCARRCEGIPSQLCEGECKDCQACQAVGWTREVPFLDFDETTHYLSY